MSPPNPERLPAELLDAAVELMGRSGRGGTVRVQGRSMIPTLHEGQLLAVEFSPRALARGDMVLFRRDDFLVVHRLLGRGRFPDGRPFLRLRGDGLPHFDPPVDPERVVGRVVAVSDPGGWRSVRTPAARIYAAGLAGHDFFWGGMTAVTRACEQAVRRLGLRAPLRRWTAALDRGLLRLLHRLMFHVLHARVPPPAEAGAVPAERP